MKRSSSRILTTHVGSLVRPQEIVAVLQGKEDGRPFAASERALVARHVAEAVRMQAVCGIAGVDCGFAQGLATARVHPSIMWEKFRMLSEGARLASRQLWP